MKYNKYQEYKSLSFPFLDEIPSEWMIVPLYALSNFRQGKLHEPYIHEDGKFICINSRFVSTEGKKLKYCSVNLSPVKKSDILMVMSDLPNGRALAKALFVKGENNYALNQRVCAITPTNIYPRFLYYQLNRNAYFLSFDDGSNQTNLSNYDFKKYPVLLPSKEEQQTIVNYLDSATAKIDTLIEKQTKLIALLKEKRQAVISTAVTRGLDNTVAMKDSGVEWLGEIPEHWEVKKLKYIGQAIIGLTYSPNNIIDENEGILVLRSSNLQNGGLYYGDNVYVNSDIPDKLITKDGDIVICSRNGSRKLIGKNAMIDKKSAGVSFGAFTSVFRSEINQYIFYILNSSLFKFQSGRFMTTTINQLTTGTLNEFQIALAPINEQDEIVSYLKEKTSKIDSLISKTTKAIDLLKEKRTALISSAVTGKIDVREIA